MITLFSSVQLAQPHSVLHFGSESRTQDRAESEIVPADVAYICTYARMQCFVVAQQYLGENAYGCDTDHCTSLQAVLSFYSSRD